MDADHEHNGHTLPAGPFDRRDWKLLAVLVIGAAIVYLPGLGRRGLWSSGEARALTIARHMIETGDWTTMAREILEPDLTVEKDGFWQDPTDPDRIRHVKGAPVHVYDTMWRQAVFTETQSQHPPPEFNWTRIIPVHKPIFFYWVVAAAGKLGLPMTAWGVRMVNAVPGILLLVMVYLMGRRWYGRAAGFWAAAALGTGVHYIWLARQSRMDMLLTLMLTVTFFCWYIGYRSRKPGTRFACFLTVYLMLAAAALMKSAAYMVLTAITILVFLLAEYVIDHRPPSGRRLGGSLTHLFGICRRMHVVAGFALFLALVLPWHVAIHQASDGQYTREIFLHGHFARAGVLDSGKDFPHETAPWFYLVRLCVDLFPWIVFVPGAVRHVFLVRNRQWWRENLFLLCWALVYLAFFSAMTYRRKAYIVPIYPPLMLLAGKMLADHVRNWRDDPWLDKALRLAFVALAGTLVLAGGFAMALGNADFVDYVVVEKELFGNNLHDQTAFHAFHRVIAEHRLAAIGSLAALTVLTAASGVFALRRRYTLACAAVAVTVAVAGAAFSHLFMDRILDRSRSHRPFAERVREARHPGEPVAVFRIEAHEVFYLLPDTHFAQYIDAPRDETGARMYTREHHYPLHALASWLGGLHRTGLVIVEQRRVTECLEELARYQHLGRLERLDLATDPGVAHRTPLVAFRYTPPS